MPRKKQSKVPKKSTRRTPKSAFKMEDGFFVLLFEEIAARVAIQHYANLIAQREPQLFRDLSAAVEAAGGWTDADLTAYCAPKGESDANQDAG